MEVEVSVKATGWLTESFTVTSSRISGMEVAVWLHVETLVNQQVAFTDTSSKRSCMEVVVMIAKSAQ